MRRKLIHNHHHHRRFLVGRRPDVASAKIIPEACLWTSQVMGNRPPQSRPLSNNGGQETITDISYRSQGNNNNMNSTSLNASVSRSCIEKMFVFNYGFLPSHAPIGVSRGKGGARGFHGSVQRLMSSLMSSREQVQRDARNLRLQKLLKQYGAKPMTPYSIDQMYEFGHYDVPGRNRSTTLLAAAQFVHEELPVRCAHLIQDLLSLPFGLSQNSAIQEVVDLFHTTIQEIVSFNRPKASKDERKLREMIKNMLRRHRNIVTHMRSALAGDLLSSEEKLALQPFLDRFYAMRIGNRTMLAHYVDLGAETKKGWVGLINDECNVPDVVKNAYNIATMVCTHHHKMKVPEISIVGDTKCQIRYVEAHLEYILTEIFHNAIYSTWKYHSEKSPKRPLPEIKVVVASGKTDITIAVSDQGGGFGRSHLDSIWTHLHFPDACFTDKKSPVDSEVSFGENESELSPLINGYSRNAPRLPVNGLPVCRLYARHFGGDLSIQVMENYGTDVFVTIPKRGDHPEALPGNNDEDFSAIE